MSVVVCWAPLRHGRLCDCVRYIFFFILFLFVSVRLIIVYHPDNLCCEIDTDSESITAAAPHERISCAIETTIGTPRSILHLIAGTRARKGLHDYEQPSISRLKSLPRRPLCQKGSQLTKGARRAGKADVKRTHRGRTQRCPVHRRSEGDTERGEKRCDDDRREGICPHARGICRGARVRPVLTVRSRG